ncbi:HNH endonuclease [Bacillus sp. FJAT-52991]|uniref:HNH endonuclease n=1 Tax=Bacillus kandeliae TaxID=3129297 RepID=A0ABZ2N2E2_9BACI
MLYYFTASDKNAQVHFHDTIQNPYPIGPLLHLIRDDEVLQMLKDNSADEYVYMWGAVPGSGNIARWNKLESGDRILAYSQGDFLYYGTIFGKTQNKEIASIIWGENKQGNSWEYIYFIKDLKPIKVSAEEFAAFFGYKLNFTPQGFSNVRKDLLDIKLKKYESIDHMVSTLNNSFRLSEDEDELDNYQQSLDSDYKDVDTNVPEKPEKRKKPRQKEGKEVWPRDAKKAKVAIKKASFMCEIDDSHESFLSASSGKQYMEAHHLIPLKVQHEFENNLDVVGNIVSLCPNCHRKIHHSQKKEKQLLLQILFKQREKVLKNYGIEIDLDYLYYAYAIKSS